MKIDDFKGLYEDFFGIEKIRKQNEEIKNELEKMKPEAILSNTEIPSIDVDNFSKDLDKWNKKLKKKKKTDFEEAGLSKELKASSFEEVKEASKEDKDSLADLISFVEEDLNSKPASTIE